MTVIRPNSVSGITSITAQANEINFFRSNGTLAGLQLNGVNFNTTTGVSTFAALKVTGNLDVEGVLTYQDVTNVDSVGIITARSNIDAQGDVSIADKIIHTGDTNTAIRFPANDTISFETSGNERLRLTHNGRVGIGTDNPPDCTLTVCEFNSGTGISDNIALRLQGSSGQNVALQFTDTTGAAAYIAVQGDALRLGTNNTERARITSDGKLLLGTTDTGFSTGYTNMTIGNTSTQNTGLTIASSPSNGFSRLHFADANSGAAVYAGFIAYSHADDALLVGTNNSGTEKLRIDSSGRLGIANTNPTTKLDVKGNIRMRQINGNSGVNSDNITLYMGMSDDLNQGKTAIIAKPIGSWGRHDLLFCLDNAADLNNVGLGDVKMTLTNDGNMGLGVNPSYSGLFGGSQTTFQIGGTAAPCLKITSSTSGQADLILHAGNSARRADIANLATNGSISIWTKPSSGSIAERLKISSAGYVTKPATPAFFATHTSASSTIIGTLTYNTSGNGYYNNGGHLDVSSGRFHAPVDGIYHFHFHGFFQSGQNNNYYEVIMYRRNSNGGGALSLTRQYGYRDQATNQYGPSISMQCTCSLSAGQTVEVSTGGLSFHGANGWYFGGHLVG